MLMAMHLVRKIAARFMCALLAVVFTAAPIAAFADVPTHRDAMTAHESAPCDMPCNDCDDNGMSASCAVACAGLAASVPATAAVVWPIARAVRVQPALDTDLRGRAREPDKPPPKTNLA